MRRAIASICLDCGLSHEPKRRQRALLRMLPCEKQELVDAFPCWWDCSGRRLGNDAGCVSAPTSQASGGRR